MVKAMLTLSAQKSTIQPSNSQQLRSLADGQYKMMKRRQTKDLVDQYMSITAKFILKLEERGELKSKTDSDFDFVNTSPTKKSNTGQKNDNRTSKDRSPARLSNHNSRNDTLQDSFKKSSGPAFQDNIEPKNGDSNQNSNNIDRSKKDLTKDINNNDLYGSDEFEGTGNFDDTKKPTDNLDKVLKDDKFESSKNKQSNKNFKDSFEGDPFEETDKNEEDPF